MSTPVALMFSIGLLAANGFFVAAEFALIASKRYRLEELAAAGSRSARAALAASHELGLMLAGAQLGITLCSLGLGALAEPALAHLFAPLLHDVGLPDDASHVVAFIVSLALVVFLHMVVGEMAPKSWAITHPEKSALILALPFRAFAKSVRLVLAVLNTMANMVLRLARVEPQSELAQAHGPRELRVLLDESRAHGTIARTEHELLTSMLHLQQTKVSQVMIPRAEVVFVKDTDSVTKIEETSRDTGRSRLLVVNEADEVQGIVHMRDAVIASSREQSVTARELMSPILSLAGERNVASAVNEMRKFRAQVALVESGGHSVGLVALEDLLEEILGEFDDETDSVV